MQDQCGEKKQNKTKQKNLRNYLQGDHRVLILGFGDFNKNLCPAMHGFCLEAAWAQVHAFERLSLRLKCRGHLFSSLTPCTSVHVEQKDDRCVHRRVSCLFPKDPLVRPRVSCHFPRTVRPCSGAISVPVRQLGGEKRGKWFFLWSFMRRERLLARRPKQGISLQSKFK